MTWLEIGDGTEPLSGTELAAEVRALLERLGKRGKVLVIPPDITRFHSGAGEITREIWKYNGATLKDILPALGTHHPMTRGERARMFKDIPEGLFRTHNWRKDALPVGTVPAAYVREVSRGAVEYAIPMEVNRLLLEGEYDRIFSIGQVVPHEVVGMASHNKNILVGVGGAECIKKSHFLGAAYGMERIMGRVDTPVRRVLNYGSEHFLREMPLVYLLTVVAPDGEGNPQTFGLFAGDDDDCFEKAAALSLRMNCLMLEEAPKKMVVYLDPIEFRSTWLGNKAIYRTRMALADGGELIILAPGVREFGEDPEIDRLIRRYGYAGRERILSLVRHGGELAGDLSAAAHLIHGSSDGRFTITYCPGGLTRREIEGVNYQFGEPGRMMRRYNPALLKDGWNRMADGGRIYYVSHPALGLWAVKSRFFEK